MSETHRANDSVREHDSAREHGGDRARREQEPHASFDRARSVFGGLTPRTATPQPLATTITKRSGHPPRARSAAFTAVPVVLTGAIALGLGLTGPIDPAHARKPVDPKPEQSPSPLGLRAALAHIGAAIVPGGLAAHTVITRTAPAVYTVAPGDTVSSIAEQFSLSTASVLALNGLSWKSTIFPDQVLSLTTAPVKTTGTPAPITRSGQYRILKGDTISSLAARFGVSTESVLRANGLTGSSIIYPGQTILIPGRVPHPTPAPAPVVGTAHDAPRTESTAGLTLSNASLTGLEEDAVNHRGIQTGRAPVVATLAIAEQAALPVAQAATPGRPASAGQISRPTPPGGSLPTTPPGPPAGGAITPLTAEMRAHASTIVQVGQQRGVPEYGIVIALATAMQESSLRNLSWGDRDSVGLFQQRPSSGWGTAADLQIPSHAALLFYEGRSGYTRGLLDIRGWQGMTLTQAAQAVQISAHPTLYAKWEASAWAWYFELS